MDSFNKLKLFILSFEGGFVNDPRDSGGATNKGVTLATYRSVYGQHKTVTDLRRLTDTEWTYIFRTRFWNKWKADDIKDDNLKYLLVDWLWASGSHGIIRPLKYLKVKPDGIVGAKTIAALNNINPVKAFNDIHKLRENFLKTRAKFSIYGKGWLRRLNSILYGKLVTNKGIIL